MIKVPTMAWYSGLSLPMLICWPCLVVRPAFMTKRFPAIFTSAWDETDTSQKSPRHATSPCYRSVLERAMVQRRRPFHQPLVLLSLQLLHCADGQRTKD